MAEITAQIELQERPAIVEDALLNGRLQLHQFAQGHRAGTDAVLLAAAASSGLSGLALDIGAGVGAAGLALALRLEDLRLGLVENDGEIAALARANSALNGVAERVLVYEADVLSPASRRKAGLTDGAADLVITNPPFLDPGRARLSPQPHKMRAHAMAESGTHALGAWIKACLALLKPKGIFIMIHRADRLGEIIAACEGRAGALTILPVHPRATEPAVRILVRARKGSRAPLVIVPALVLHEGDRFTPQAEAIHRGEALIEW
jgi:tRNA1(Val) A37 N6-methylase TrmN6